MDRRITQRSTMDYTRSAVKAQTGSKTGYDKLDRDDLIELVIKAKTCPKAMEKVFYAVYPYMNNIAHKVHLSGSLALSQEDLFQASYFGLRRAVERYDPTHLNPQGNPISFTTYVTHWLKQTVSREMANVSEVIRLPVHAHTAIRTIKTRYKEWCEENWTIEKEIHTLQPDFIMGLLPDDSKITKGNVEAILYWMANGKVFDSLDRTYEGSDGSTGDSIVETVSTGTTTEGEFVNFMENKDIRDKIKLLPQRKRLVIYMRFGVGPFPEQTLQEAGDILGLTRERVRQIESLALRMLKSWFTRDDDFIGLTFKGKEKRGSTKNDIIGSDIIEKLTEEQIRFLLDKDEIKSLAATVDGYDYLLTKENTV